MEKQLVKCQNIIRNNDGLVSFDAFEELSKILFTIMKSNKKLDLNGVKNEYKNFNDFFSDNNINLKDGSIEKIMSELYLIDDLFSKDIKGRVYEIFLGKIFQSELGQFLTPKNIVRFIVQFVSIIFNKKTNINVLDPSCGSGGFLIEIIKYFNNCKLYGFDVNKRILDIAKRNLYLHNQDISNLFLQNFLDDNIDENSMDIVLSNPPFGVKETNIKILSKYILSNGKKQISLEEIFIEKIIKILKPGGICGIVLPDGLLNNPTSNAVRKLIYDNTDIICSVDLPENAFKSSGTGCETSILFFKKKDKIDKNYNIFFGKPMYIGYETKTKNAKDIPNNDLLNLINDYKSNKISDSCVFINSDEINSGDRLDGKYYITSYFNNQNNLNKLNNLVVKSGDRLSDKTLKHLKYIQYSDLNEDLGEILTSTEYYNKEDLPNRAKIIVKYGDIICAKLKQSSKKISVVEKEYDGYIVSNGFFVIRPKTNKIEDSYLISYILKSDYCQNQIKSFSVGTIMPAISDDDFMNINIINMENKEDLTDKIYNLKKIFKKYKENNKSVIDYISMNKKE